MTLAAIDESGVPIPLAEDSELFDYIVRRAPDIARTLGLAPDTVGDALVDGMRLGIAVLARMMLASLQEGDRGAANDCLWSADAAAQRWQMAGLVISDADMHRRHH